MTTRGYSLKKKKNEELYAHQVLNFNKILAKVFKLHNLNANEEIGGKPRIIILVTTANNCSQGNCLIQTICKGQNFVTVHGSKGISFLPKLSNLFELTVRANVFVTF